MKLSTEDIKWLFGIIKRVDFLSFYCSEELDELFEKMEKRVYVPNKIIIQQGDAGKFFFLIHQGQVTVYVRHDKEEKPVASLSSGEYFGEMSLLTGHPCNATVKTDTQTEVFLLYSKDFSTILKRNPTVADDISRAVSRRQSKLQHLFGEQPIEQETVLHRIRKYFNIKE